MGMIGHAAQVIYGGKANQRNIQHALYLEAKDYHTTIYVDDVVVSNLKYWLFAFKHMNGVPLTWVFSHPTNFMKLLGLMPSLKRKR